MKKKICFLIGNLNHSGGTERVTTLIANQLAQKKRCQVLVLSLSGGTQPFFELEPTICTYSLFEQQLSMKKNFFTAVWRIRKFMLSHKIDTLIVVDSISCVFTVPALIGLKNIKHICWEHFNFNVNLGVKFRDIGRKLAAKYCDYVITLTKRDKELWKQGIKNIRAKIIPIFNPSPYDVQQNTPSLEYKTILCVGRLTYQKGFDLLIPAWAKIAQQVPDWKIIIVGTGEDEVMLKQMAKDYAVDHSIIFAGQQKDMDSFYRKASFFCMSSRFEGLPMVLLEAQSYGLPIVAFDCDTGPCELISNQNGRLIGKENISELAIAMLQVATLEENEFNDLIQHSLINTNNFKLGHVICMWESII